MERQFKKIKKVAAGVGAVVALTFVSLSITAGSSAVEGDEIVRKIESSQEYKEFSGYYHKEDVLQGFIISGKATAQQKADYDKVQYNCKVTKCCMYMLPLLAIGGTFSFALYQAAQNKEEKLK